MSNNSLLPSLSSPRFFKTPSIDARKILRDVKSEVNVPGQRRSDRIAELKDNRGLFQKLFGYGVQQESSKEFSPRENFREADIATSIARAQKLDKSPRTNSVNEDAKKQILADLGRFNIDDRSFLKKLWDKFWKIEESEELKEKNKLFLESVKLAFNGVVQENKSENKDFDHAVFLKLPKDIRQKLKNGKRLTDEEVGKLRNSTYLAMQKQRYINDLKSAVPAKIKGNLNSAFKGKIFEKALFDKYLHKLKEELIRGNYPSLVTSSSDVRKFIFIRDGKHEVVVVNSLQDLNTLEVFLNNCISEAESYIPKELKLENIVESQQKTVIEIETVAKNLQLEVEELRIKNQKLDSNFGKQQEINKKNQQKILEQEAAIEIQKQSLAESEAANAQLKQQIEELTNKLENIQNKVGTIEELNSQILSQTNVAEEKERLIVESEKRLLEQQEEAEEWKVVADNIQENYVQLILLGQILGATAAQEYSKDDDEKG